MVNVTPFGTTRLALTLYGPAAGVQNVSVARVPETFCSEPSSYQMSTELRLASAPSSPKACTSTRLTPGCRFTVPRFHAPERGDQLARTPFTRTARVSRTLAWPLSETVGLVVRSKPFETARLLTMVGLVGICESTNVLREACHDFM